MQGAKDLLASERGVFCIVLTIVTGAFVLFGKMTIQQWQDFAQVTMVVLVGSKTITGVSEHFAARRQIQLAPPPPASSPPLQPPA